MENLEHICLQCPLETCDDKDARCGIRPYMCASWLKSNPVRGETAEYDKRRREIQRKYDQKPERKARRNELRRMRRKAGREAGTMPKEPAADRRDYWREYKRRKKAEAEANG